MSEQLNEARRREIFAEALAKNNVDRCVIVTGSFRAGTSFVCSLLGQNGMKGIRLEHFNKFYPLSQPGHEEEFQDELARVFGSATDGLFVTKIMWPHRNALARCLGFGRAQAADLARSFPNARWINIERRDKVGQAISFWKAKTTNTWEVVGEDTAETPVPDYDFKELCACLNEQAAHDLLWRDFHEQAGTNVRHVVYEDFLRGSDEDLPALLEFLDDHRLPSGEIVTTSPLKKQRNKNSETLREQLLEDLYK